MICVYASAVVDTANEITEDTSTDKPEISSTTFRWYRNQLRTISSFNYNRNYLNHYKYYNYKNNHNYYN